MNIQSHVSVFVLDSIVLATFLALIVCETLPGAE